MNLNLQNVTTPAASAPETQADSPLEILIVEDEPQYASWLRAYLEIQAKQIETAVTITTCRFLQDIERVQNKSRIQLILLDLNLPDSHGIHTLEMVQKNYPNQVIICLTANDDPKDEIRALQLGAQSYIVKGKEDSQPLITSIKHAIERNLAIQKSNEQLKKTAAREGLSSIGLLTRGIAQEFNNITTIIEIAAKSLIEEDTSKEELAYKLDRIIKSCEKSRKITQSINNLNVYSNELKKSELENCVTNSIMLCRSLLEEYGIHVNVENTINKTVKVLGGSIVSQAIVNILVNAVDVMKTQSQRGIHILILEEDTSEYYQVCIADTGPGIDDDCIERIFDPFFTTKGPFVKSSDLADHLDSTGLGLSIARANLLSIGGNITAENKAESNGALFTIHIPNPMK